MEARKLEASDALRLTWPRTYNREVAQLESLARSEDLLPGSPSDGESLADTINNTLGASTGVPIPPEVWGDLPVGFCQDGVTGCRGHGNYSAPQGVKYDSEKIRMDLIPPEALQAIAERFTIGAKKYGDRNWENGIGYSRIYGAVLRHLVAWFSGEDRDPETPEGIGDSHLDAAFCNLAMLSTFARRGMTHLDDRPRKHTGSA